MKIPKAPKAKIPSIMPKKTASVAKAPKPPAMFNKGKKQKTYQ